MAISYHSGVGYERRDYGDGSNELNASTAAQVGVLEMEFSSEGEELSAFPGTGNPGPQVTIATIVTRYRAILRLTYNLITMDTLADAAGWKVGGSGDAKTVGVGTGLLRLIGGKVRGILGGPFFQDSQTEMFIESLGQILPGTTNTITIDGTPNTVVHELSCIVEAGDDGFIKMTQQAFGTGYPV